MPQERASLGSSLDLLFCPTVEENHATALEIEGHAVARTYGVGGLDLRGQRFITSPAEGCSKSEIMFSVVVFPHPDGPTKATN